jgi:hypothetical protein
MKANCLHWNNRILRTPIQASRQQALAYGYTEIGAMRCFEQSQKISGDVSIPTIANTYSVSSQH